MESCVYIHLCKYLNTFVEGKKKNISFLFLESSIWVWYQHKPIFSFIIWNKPTCHKGKRFPKVKSQKSRTFNKVLKM